MKRREEKRREEKRREEKRSKSSGLPPFPAHAPHKYIFITCVCQVKNYEREKFNFCTAARARSPLWFHLDAPSRRSTRWDCMGNVASPWEK
jgi:hypothetical protein